MMKVGEKVVVVVVVVVVQLREDFSNVIKNIRTGKVSLYLFNCSGKIVFVFFW